MFSGPSPTAIPPSSTRWPVATVSEPLLVNFCAQTPTTPTLSSSPPQCASTPPPPLEVGLECGRLSGFHCCASSWYRSLAVHALFAGNVYSNESSPKPL